MESPISTRFTATIAKRKKDVHEARMCGLYGVASGGRYWQTLILAGLGNMQMYNVVIRSTGNVLAK